MKGPLIVALVCGLQASSAQAQDCTAGPASTAAERMLCTHPSIRTLDENLRSAQRQYRSTAMIDAWRDRLAQRCADDADCLMAAYVDELAHTQRILNARTEKRLTELAASASIDTGEGRGTAPGSPAQGMARSRAGKSPEEIFALASRSVVLVAAYGKRLKVLDKVAYGGGVAIAPNRVATNCHVIADMERIVVAHDGNTHPAKLLAESPRHDICVLQVDHLPAAPVSLRPLSEARPGQIVYVIGNPLNIGLSISDGLLSAVVDADRLPETRLASKLIHFNAETWQGNSGGGLFDDQGALLGIPTLRWVARGQPPMNLAVPLSEVALVGQFAARPNDSQKVPRQ